MYLAIVTPVWVNIFAGMRSNVSAERPMTQTPTVSIADKKGLENDDSPDDVTHNWLYSAGVKFALGQRRRDTGPVAVAPRDDRALQEARAELTELRDSVRLAGRDSVWRIGRDSVRLAGGEPDARDTRARSLADDGATPRNYQSAERIEMAGG